MVYDLGNIIEIVSPNLNVCTYVQTERGIAWRGKGRKGIMGESGEGEKRMLIFKISLSRISY